MPEQQKQAQRPPLDAATPALEASALQELAALYTSLNAMLDGLHRRIAIAKAANASDVQASAAAAGSGGGGARVALAAGSHSIEYTSRSRRRWAQAVARASRWLPAAAGICDA